MIERDTKTLQKELPLVIPERHITPRDVVDIVDHTANPEADISEAFTTYGRMIRNFPPDVHSEARQELIATYKTQLSYLHFSSYLWNFDEQKTSRSQTGCTECLDCGMEIGQGNLMVTTFRSPEEVYFGEATTEHSSTIFRGPTLQIPYIDYHTVSEHATFLSENNGETFRLTPEAVRKWQQESSEYLAATPGGKPIVKTLLGDYVDRAFSKTAALFGVKNETEFKYDIPNIVESSVGVFSNEILFKGPKDNVQIYLSDGLKAMNLNQFAPFGTRFALIDNNYYLPSHVSTETQVISVSPREFKRELLPYALLHSIARLQVHRGSDWKEKLKQPVEILALHVPQKDTDIAAAWQVVAEEERLVGEYALHLLAELRKNQFNPYPQIKTCAEIGEKVINQDPLARTVRQGQYRLGNLKKKGINMIIPESRIREIIGEFYS